MNHQEEQRHWGNDLSFEFPVKIKSKTIENQETMFESHWHEYFQILYFESGEAVVYCNSQKIVVQANDLVMINSNDIHYGQGITDQLSYHIIKVDVAFLLSNQVDLCQAKYLSPLLQGQIRFQNHIRQDMELLYFVRRIIAEYAQGDSGYELAIKAAIYNILVVLLRNYQQQGVSDKTLQKVWPNIQRLRSVLTFIEAHYEEEIQLAQLVRLASMSEQYFCRIFKQTTGKRPMEYINYLRIEKATALLLDRELNISEIAMKVGFDDSNYFSRLFKKYKKISPSGLRKLDGDKRTTKAWR